MIGKKVKVLIPFEVEDIFCEENSPYENMVLMKNEHFVPEELLLDGGCYIFKSNYKKLKADQPMTAKELLKVEGNCGVINCEEKAIARMVFGKDGKATALSFCEKHNEMAQQVVTDKINKDSLKLWTKKMKPKKAKQESSK